MSSGAETVVITPYEDGPYLIRGPFTMRDQHGNQIEVSRRTVALCRCGRSRTRPFCDGTHRQAGFHAPTGREPSPGDNEAREAQLGTAGGGGRS
jgi:CDGSH-type Zn-finger protein